MGFTGGSDHKESACNAGDPDLIPGSGRSPCEGSDNPLQYFCLENSVAEELGGPQSMGSRRVRHNRATEQHKKEINPQCNFLNLFLFQYNVL